jgi:hypothetical protein
VKQLHELTIGAPVGGMKDIEDDLKFERFGTHVSYVRQYKCSKDRQTSV